MSLAMLHLFTVVLLLRRPLLGCPPSASSPSAAASHPAVQRDVSEPRHRLIVLVPVRGTTKELLVLVHRLGAFLEKHQIAYELWAIEQQSSAAERRFNRGALLNAGVVLTRDRGDYLALHDVDLIPLDERLDYGFPGEHQPMHLSPASLHPKYHYPDFLGGVLVLSRALYVRLDGMSNLFWGWGKEDDEFAQRLREQSITVAAPHNIPPLWVNRQPVADIATRPPVFEHIHDDQERPRDKNRIGDQAKLKKDANRDK